MPFLTLCNIFTNPGKALSNMPEGNPSQNLDSQPGIRDLDGFMSVFKDIRRAAVIIADSVRTRELHALRGTGLLREGPRIDVESAQMTAPACCPLCLEAFFDKTVVSMLCGHGMHAACADKFIPPGDGDDSRLCPICRLPFNREELVELKGVLPTVDNWAAWKTIILTQPWETDAAPTPPHSRRTVDGCAERLLIQIKSLFHLQNDFSQAMGQVLAIHKDVTSSNEEERNRLRRMMEEVIQRERKADQARSRLSELTYRTQSLVVSCDEQIWKERSMLGLKLDSVVRQQLKLERLNSEIKANEEALQDRTKEFNDRMKSEKKSLLELKKRVAAEKKELERRLIAEAAKGEDVTSVDRRGMEQCDVDSVVVVEDEMPTPPSVSEDEGNSTDAQRRGTGNNKRIRLE